MLSINFSVISLTVFHLRFCSRSRVMRRMKLFCENSRIFLRGTIGYLQLWWSYYSCSKCMVLIWHHFANSFYLIFIILRWNYTFWWKDHVKKATTKGKSKARMLYNLQPLKKISDFSKWMVLINFKVDFEHLFGLPKQLFIDRELIAMGTDVNR